MNQLAKQTSLNRRKWGVPFLSLFLVFCLLSLLLINLRPVLAAAVENGYRDFSYTGASAPTGQKPQSKLWYNDGYWWGSLFNKSSGKYEIYRFNRSQHTWSTTNTALDPRRRSSADVMWDGNFLYVVSAVPPGLTGDIRILLMRYTYNSANKTYTIDSGFPISLGNRAVEAVVMDKDTAGKVWVTYTDTNGSGGRSVYVMHTTNNDLTWTAPYIIPVQGTANLDSDDISAAVSFNGKIGVMWSNQTENSVYFAFHVDGAPDTEWSLNPAVQGPRYADDHLNIKSLVADDSGQVFAAVKTSLNDKNPPNPDDPLILLLTLDNHGSWTRRTFGRVADDHTRPIVVIDNQNRQAYVFATVPVGSATSGAIYYKSVSLDDKGMQFTSGLGTPFMLSSQDTHINNASSTKQPVNTSTGLLVIAGDDTSKYYFHNTIDLGQLPATATVPPIFTPTFTATATNPPQATATFTPTATTIPVEPTPTETQLPSPTPVPGVLFQDGFESGDFSAWTVVKTGTDGVAAVQNAVVHSGSYSAMFSATANTGSLAYARKTLDDAPMNVTVSGNFMVTVEGVKGANVPLIRLFNTQGNRVINVFRLNLTGNKIQLQHSGNYHDTIGTLPLNTWGHVAVQVAISPSGPGTVRVFLDGAQIYETSNASLGTVGIQNIQIGNETAKQTFQLYADNILVQP